MPKISNFYEGGFGYEIYAPENANANTPVVVSLGTAQRDALATQQQLIESQYGRDVIIVYISGQDYLRGQHEQIASARDEAYQILANKYNFDGVAEIYMGTSNRGSQCVSLALDDYKKYQNDHGTLPKGATFLTFDARRGNDDSTGFPDFGIEGQKLLSQTNSKLLVYNWDYPEHHILEVEELVKNNVDCILITSDLDHNNQSNYNIDNGAIQLGLGLNNEMTNMNIYTFGVPKRNANGEVILDSNGRVEWEQLKWNDLSQEQQEYVKMQLQSNRSYHSNVKFSDFTNISKKLSQLPDLKAISNDQAYVVDLMNNIRKAITSTNLLSHTTALNNCQSTTQVPTKAESLLYNYYSIVLNLLDKLATECETAISIGESIEETDRQLAELTHSDN